MNAPLPSITMTVPEFLTWSARQPETERYELVDGKVVPMSPERARHNLVKLDVAIALRQAVREADLPCTVFTDGMGIAIDDRTVREPDASVQCGVAVDPDAVLVSAPIIVVEVTSPSSERVDADDKFVDYFAVPTIEHYLIVLSGKRVVVHHRRKQDGTIESRILHDGDVVLDPPGLTVPVAALLGPDLGVKEIH
ncbi:Uma2 family endonuclease [Rhodoplanes serenus]|uniref:Uma2 family endonuclease n=1 Tax=Rhodoplanes serenus TaxID=200615 RepID=UPI001FE07D8B|nr:Uma2 family endonuclease [Rhodoplanes serenus]